MSSAETRVVPPELRRLPPGGSAGRHSFGGGPWRGGFTILELLTTIGIIALLAALLLPAIGSAREAARRMQCANQLKQIGLALHCYHEDHQSLPVGWQWETSGQSAYGWAVSLLPYLEEREIYRLVDRGQTLEQPSHDEARRAVIPFLLCPSDITTATFLLFDNVSAGIAPQPLFELPTANYVGVFGTFEADDQIPSPPGDGAFVESRSVRFTELERGLSNTLLVGERTMARVPSTWLGVDARGEDAACRLVGSAITAPNCSSCDECEFDSRHAGGSMFVWGDGHARLLSEQIDAVEYRRLAARSGP